MMSTAQPDNVIFNPPVITPRHYIAKSSAGWPETFDRKKADEELKKFLAPLDVDEIVEMFITSREIGEKRADRITSWHTIVGHLSRTMTVRYDLVPTIVAIAFWAHVVMTVALDEEGN